MGTNKERMREIEYPDEVFEILSKLSSEAPEMNVDDKETVVKFARWVSGSDVSSSLLTELKSLICMRCGVPRPSILEAAKGGRWCCYPPVG